MQGSPAGGNHKRLSFAGVLITGVNRNEERANQHGHPENLHLKQTRALEKLDWGKTYHQLAKENGVTPATIRKEFLRIYPGQRKHFRTLRETTVFKKLDWGKSYHQLAKENGVTPATVRMEFLRIYPGQRKYIRKVRPADKPTWRKYKKWDWRQSNASLAREHSLTAERVRQIRQALGIRNAWARPRNRYAGVDWTMSHREIATQLGLKVVSVHMYARRHGLSRPMARRKSKKP